MNKAPYDISRYSKTLSFATILLVIFVAALHFLFLIPGTDSGIFMYGSLLLSKGHLPYTYLWDDKPPLIYLVGYIGFLIKSFPFLGVRIFEVIIFFIDLVLIRRICKALSLARPNLYLVAFCALFLIFWDQGFLTETFNIPLVLLTVYLFVTKHKYLAFWLPLFLVASFLLKQNSIVVIGLIGMLDVFSKYRKGHWVPRIVKYVLATSLYSLIAAAIIIKLGVWSDFIDQAFTYNFRYIHQHNLLEVFIRYINEHTLLSITSLVFITVFHIALTAVLIHYYKRYKKGELFSMKDKVMVFSILIYALAFYVTYISGRTYPHYFMMLIVPTTFIIAGWATRKLVGAFSVLLLLTIGIILNLHRAKQYYSNEGLKTETAIYVKHHTPINSHIYVVGMNDAWLYLYTDRLSSSKFINPVPFEENEQYSGKFKSLFKNELHTQQPSFIIVNRNDYQLADKQNFYYQTLDTLLLNYQKVYENRLYSVWNQRIY